MVSKARLQLFGALAGLIGASALVTDALQHQLWGNLLFGCLIIGGCLAYLRGLQPQIFPDPPLSNEARYDRTDSLTVLVDEAPLPLLRFSPAEGMHAVNRAARSLFCTDDVIIDPPQSLVDAVTRAEAGKPGSLIVFGRTYAVGISEFVTAKYTTRLISLADIQSEVRMAEATALRDLLRVLSHEIMNSLTPVANLAGIARDILKDETSPASHAAREALELLAERASGLARFVEAYRSMARLPEPVIRPVELGPLLRDVVLVFEQSVSARSASVELDLPPGCPIIELDETLFTQALLNVLTNAAEATEGVAGTGRIRISSTNDDNEVRIVVADNGRGVPDGLIEQIFHAFVTTKPNGTGTGLNLARQIALAHGGDLIFLGAKDSWSAVFAFVLRVTAN